MNCTFTITTMPCAIASNKRKINFFIFLLIKTSKFYNFNTVGKYGILFARGDLCP